MEIGGFDLKRDVPYVIGYVLFLVVSLLVFSWKLTERPDNTLCLLPLYLILPSLAVAFVAHYRKMPLKSAGILALATAVLLFFLALAFFATISPHPILAIWTQHGDTKIIQSNSYWRSEARPFGIIEHDVTSSGSATFVIKNQELFDTLTLMTLSVGNASYTIQTPLAPGEKKDVRLTLQPGETGTVYQFYVNFTYTKADGESATQYGAKDLVGKYT